MNKRIQQLKQQAIAEVATEYGTEIKYFTDKLDTRCREKVDGKFAELIVKECWTTISPFIEDDNLAEDALAELKEHFGVEE